MIEELITDEFLKRLFPPEKADEFFEALYGGAETGAFDIALKYKGFNEPEGILFLEFILTERPGKCMACSLTQGLPPVFQRHPVINIKNIVEKIDERISDWSVEDWSIGSTAALNSNTNSIPMMLKLTKR